MFFSGYLSSTGSYSVSLSWSGGVSGPCPDPPTRSLLSHPGHQKLQFTSINGTGTLRSSCPYFNSPRCVHSRWLAPRFGMGFRWHCDRSPRLTLTHSTTVLKLLFLAVLES